MKYKWSAQCLRVKHWTLNCSKLLVASICKAAAAVRGCVCLNGRPCSVLWLLLICSETKCKLFTIYNINPKLFLLCLFLLGLLLCKISLNFRLQHVLLQWLQDADSWVNTKNKPTNTHSHSALRHRTHNQDHLFGDIHLLRVGVRVRAHETHSSQNNQETSHGQQSGPTSLVALSLLCLDRNFYFLTAFPHSAVLCENTVSKCFSWRS